MRYALSHAARGELERFSQQRGLLVLDYDGTLSPIVSDPARAAMRDRTAALLAQLAQRQPVAVLSGRSRADLLGRLLGIPLAGIIGNHGAEPDDPTGQEAQLRSVVAGWRAALADVPALVEGAVIEDKGLSLSVHYRSTPDPAAAGRRLRRILGHLAGARLVGGKRVFNLLPASAPNKGTAFEQLRALHGRGLALFVGDDLTDEDVFRRCRCTSGALGIRVGRSATSAARYYLRDQSEIDALLEALLTGTPPAAVVGPHPREGS
jgi:trehalose 6-phosphate phosphatase